MSLVLEIKLSYLILSSYLNDIIATRLLWGYVGMHPWEHLKQDAREAMRVVFSVLTKCICMHKTKFLMNIFKYCFKDYIKLHEFANCNSFNYDA